MNDILKKIEELEKELETLKEQVKLNNIEKWPKHGDRYYFIDTHCEPSDYVWRNDDTDYELLYANNCFKTRERAEEVAEKIRLLLLLEKGHDEYCPEFKPCFKVAAMRKNYLLFYDYMSHKWTYSYNYQVDNKHDVYFDSEESAQKMCNMLNNEEYRKMREAENDI